MNPYANSRVYGPYYRKDGRQHVIVIFPNNKRTTVSYPRYLIETIIGRKLDTFEDVHHINGDVTDNRLENFEIVNTNTHKSNHIARLIAQDFLCPVCKKEFTLRGKYLSNLISNRLKRPNQTGPYCSTSCAGKGSTIQSPISQEYFTLVSLQLETSEVDAANSGNAVIDENPELG